MLETTAPSITPAFKQARILTANGGGVFNFKEQCLMVVDAVETF